MKKFFVFSAIILLLLCGCSRKKAPAQTRVVTRADITCHHEDVRFSRNYTDPEKLQAVLLYLRLIKPAHRPKAAPDGDQDEFYEIRLELSDGQTRLYRQADHKYFWQPNTGWRHIPADRAAGLYDLLRRYESDI